MKLKKIASLILASALVFASSVMPVYADPSVADPNGDTVEIEGTFLATVITVEQDLAMEFVYNPNNQGNELTTSGYEITSLTNCPLGIDVKAIELPQASAYELVAPDGKTWNELTTSDKFMAIGVKLDEDADNDDFTADITNTVWSTDIAADVALGELAPNGTVSLDVDVKAPSAIASDHAVVVNMVVYIKLV